MADSTLNRFVASGTSAERAAFTPTPPTPASGPDPGYLWWDTDDQLEYAYDFGLADWVVVVAAGAGTVTNTGTLTDHAVVVGNGGADVSTLASLGTSGQVLTSAGAGADPAFATAGLTFIEELTPSGVGTITFSSLGSYTHLEIRYSARGTQAATETNLNLTVNGDTGSNYDWNTTIMGGSTLTGADGFGDTRAFVGNVSAASATANYAGAGTIRLYDVIGTTFFKTGDSHTQGFKAASAFNYPEYVNAFAWRNTAAITSITLALASGNYVAGSKFTLYGLR